MGQQNDAGAATCSLWDRQERSVSRGDVLALLDNCGPSRPAAGAQLRAVLDHAGGDRGMFGISELQRRSVAGAHLLLFRTEGEALLVDSAETETANATPNRPGGSCG